jgi:hypothetical protein
MELQNPKCHGMNRKIGSGDHNRTASHTLKHAPFQQLSQLVALPIRVLQPPREQEYSARSMHKS